MATKWTMLCRACATPDAPAPPRHIYYQQHLQERACGFLNNLHAPATPPPSLCQNARSRGRIKAPNSDGDLVLEGMSLANLISRTNTL